MLKPLLLVTTLGLLLPSGAHASPEEIAKLREALRGSMLQVRDMQNKIATLEAQDADKAFTIEDLEAKLASAQKRLADDKSTADRAIALLEERNEKQEAEIGQLRVAVEKWKASHKEAVSLAQKTEMLRNKLSREKVALERIVSDQRTKNHEMFKAGMEVLERYKDHALGDAILAREPFTGNMRARFQQLAQEYGDKLSDQRIKPGDAAASTAASTKPGANPATATDL